MPAFIYDIPLKRIDGTPATLGEYKGEVLLIVNVASKCGKTPQYEGLEALYKAKRGKGLAVLGFPCNQFGGQEPGTEGEIAAFCRTVYGVDFPMFAKLDVKGPEQHPLYAALTGAQPKRSLSPAVASPKPVEGEVRWNFEKFLIGRNGKVIGRYDPDVTPGDAVLTGAIETELKMPA